MFIPPDFQTFQRYGPAMYVSTTTTATMVGMGKLKFDVKLEAVEAAELTLEVGYPLLS